MAEKNKKRGGRRAHLNDFHVNLAGDYVYTGAHYSYVDQGRSRDRVPAARLDAVGDQNVHVGSTGRARIDGVLGDEVALDGREAARDRGRAQALWQKRRCHRRAARSKIADFRSVCVGPYRA